MLTGVLLLCVVMLVSLVLLLLLAKEGVFALLDVMGSVYFFTRARFDQNRVLKNQKLDTNQRRRCVQEPMRLEAQLQLRRTVASWVATASKSVVRVDDRMKKVEMTEDCLCCCWLVGCSAPLLACC